MKNIEIKSFLDFQFPSAPEFSPDGKTVAFVLQQPSLEENKYNGNIWLMDVETRKYRQLTNGGDGKGYHKRDWRQTWSSPCCFFLIIIHFRFFVNE